MCSTERGLSHAASCTEARAVLGVASVRPHYITKPLWKNPQSLRLSDAQIFAHDPDQPVFDMPEISDYRDAPCLPDAMIVDRRPRSEFGTVSVSTETELSRHKIKVVGTFLVGPNFFTNGTVIMSDLNYFKLFGCGGSNPLPIFQTWMWELSNCSPDKIYPTCNRHSETPCRPM